jgi:endoglucanase
VFYELMNEPELFGGQGANYIDCLNQIINCIRSVDKTHTVVISGGWGLGSLLQACVVDDPNAVYTFHDYTPGVYTHQGAEWVSNNAENVPFSVERNDAFYQKLNDAINNPNINEQTRQALIAYKDDIHITKKIEENFKRIVQFGKFSSSQIFLGEFGAMGNDSASYYSYIANLCMQYGFGYNSWFVYLMWGGDEIALNREIFLALGFIV